MKTDSGGKYKLVCLCSSLALLLLAALFFGDCIDRIASLFIIRDTLQECDIIFTHSDDLCGKFSFSVYLLKLNYAGRIVLAPLESPPYKRRCMEKYYPMKLRETVVDMMVTDHADTSKFSLLPPAPNQIAACNFLRELWEEERFGSILMIVGPLESRINRLHLATIFEGTDVKIVTYPTYPSIPVRELFVESRDYYVALYLELTSFIHFRLRFLLNQIGLMS